MKKIVGIGIILLILLFAIVGGVASEAPPVVTNPTATPPSIPADAAAISQLNVTVTDDSVVASVSIDLSAIGGSATAVMTNMGDDVYSVTTTAAIGTAGIYDLQVNATDIYGNSNTSVSIRLTVTEAEGHTVTGIVTGINQEPISGATVTINGYSGTTDATGNYILTGVPTGTYTVTATATGYRAETKSAVTITTDTIVNFTVNDGLVKECPVTTTYVLQVINKWAAGEISSTTKVLQQINIWAECV